MATTVPHQQPTPERFFDSINAYQQTEAMKAAIELEIFTAVAELGPKFEIKAIAVVNDKGVIIAHTFVPGVPDEILADYKAAKEVYDRTLAGLGSFSEVTAGILAGEAGYVHVGMDKGYIALQVQTAIGKEVYLLSIILIASVLASYGLMYLVSRPLDHLRSYAWHSLSSEQHASPPDSSQVKRLLERTDEVGELGRIIRWASGRES